MTEQIITAALFDFDRKVNAIMFPEISDFEIRDDTLLKYISPDFSIQVTEDDIELLDGIDTVFNINGELQGIEFFISVDYMNGDGFITALEIMKRICITQGIVIRTHYVFEDAQIFER